MLVDARDIVLDTLERNARISHQLDARLDLVRGTFDQLIDLLGGLCRALGKFADFLGNNRKALTCLTRSCGLDACLERKQFRLKRNFSNDTDDVRNLFRGLLERRRSEIAGLRKEQLQPEEPIQIDGGPPLLSLSIHLGRTKTSDADNDEVVYISGRPVDAVNAWLTAAKIDKGSVFRAIDRWGNVSRRPLDPKAINDIVKQRAQMAGLDPREFSAHGLRSGYLTEAADRGIPLPEAMEQSRHRSVQQASEYYNHAHRRSGRASRLLG